MSHSSAVKIKQTTTYQSVSCAMHSELELAIIQGVSLDIHYNNALNEPAIKITIQAIDRLFSGFTLKKIKVNFCLVLIKKAICLKFVWIKSKLILYSLVNKLFK